MEPLPQHTELARFLDAGLFSNPYTGARGCHGLGVQFPVGSQTCTPVTEGGFWVKQSANSMLGCFTGVSVVFRAPFSVASLQ